MTKNYHEGKYLFAFRGNLFNHESPRKNETFIICAIIRAITQILGGKDTFVCLGNRGAKCYGEIASEYVECIWRILKQEKPDNFVIDTEEIHSMSKS